MNQPTPDGGTFLGNVVIEIASSEPNGIDACTLYLDDVTFSTQNKRFTSSEPVRLVAGATEPAGRRLELSFDEPQDPSDSGYLTVINGVGARIAPSGSLLVSLGEPKTGSSEALASRQPASVRARTKAADNRASSLEEEPTVVLDIELVKFLTDQPLSPEAAAQLSNLWDQMYAKREAGPEQRGSLPRVDELQISPRALLERCTKDGQGDSEAIKIMVDLLVSLEHAHVVMNPRVEVFDGQQAQVMSKQHVPNPTAQPGAPETVECRDLVTVTPRIDSAGQITLDLAAEICDVILNDSKTPRISKHSIDTKAVVDRNRTFVCRLESAAEGETQDNGVLYLLAHPRVVRSAPSSSVAIQTAKSRPSGPPTVTATFEGTDKCEALETVAEMARVSIVYDANLPGEVYATLDDVSIETALRTILAGSPYVATRTPDGYAVLLKAIRRYPGSTMLAAPKVIVRDAESAGVRVSRQFDYVSRYREPDDTSAEAVPQHSSKDIGATFDATAQIIEDQNDIRLQFEMEINSLLGMRKAVYRDGYEYDIPSIETVKVGTEIVIPDSKTALVYAGQARSLTSEGEPARPLLLLVKAKKSMAAPDEPAPATQPEGRPGDPGMGGLPPGTPASLTG